MPGWVSTTVAMTSRDECYWKQPELAKLQEELQQRRLYSNGKVQEVCRRLCAGTRRETTGGREESSFEISLGRGCGIFFLTFQ